MAASSMTTTSRRPFGAVLDDDSDDESMATGVATSSLPPRAPNTQTATSVTAESISRPRGRRMVDDDSDDDDDEQSITSSGRVRPPRPSMASSSRISMAGGGRHHHHRRRNSSLSRASSSARRRSSVMTVRSQKDAAALESMYQTALQLHAENKINASNSWNLQLLDHIDQFLQVTNTSTTTGGSSSNTKTIADHDNEQPAAGNNNTTVNFTKASCTLDASVKIYSYRVDDVHLTSYKVLANLHRNGKAEDDNNSDVVPVPKDDGDAVDEDGNIATTNTQAKKGRTNKQNATYGPTLESNQANINWNKLDAALEIDPLFSKLSQTFDEGGAKGLLLVNLGLGDRCNVLLDGSLQDDDNEVKMEQGTARRAEGLMDISTLQTKLDGLLRGQSIHELPLVPQLADLRQELNTLERDGFVDANDLTGHVVAGPAGKRRHHHRAYAASAEDEQAADQSIHQDHLERSRMSFKSSRTSMGSKDKATDDTYVSPSQPLMDDDDDYGGMPFDDGDDDDAFDAFIANDDESNAQQRSSSMPVACSTAGHGDGLLLFGDDNILTESQQATACLLDAMANGQVTTPGDWTQKQQQSSSQANAWAGAKHWKRAPRSKAAKATTASESETAKPVQKKKTATKKKKKSSTLIDFSVVPANLDDILRQPPAPKRRKNSKSVAPAAVDPLQLSQANMKKYSKTDNTLPPDAGMGLEQLHQLYLRPNMTIAAAAAAAGSASEAANKTVGFGAVETFGADDDEEGGMPWDDGSLGDNDDSGPGFAMNDDALVPALNDIRKVAKVQVGYVTVAKRVDVKRLKTELWQQLESQLAAIDGDNVVAAAVTDDEASDEDNDEFMATEIVTTTRTSAPGSSSSSTGNNMLVFFQDAVRDMERRKSQADATLPFYFICLLHLANEHNLQLHQEPGALSDFGISRN